MVLVSPGPATTSIVARVKTSEPTRVDFVLELEPDCRVRTQSPDGAALLSLHAALNEQLFLSV